MTAAEQQLDTIREKQRLCSEGWKSVAALDGDDDDILRPLAFVLEVKRPRPLASLEVQIDDILDGVNIELETLFLDDTNPEFFLLTVLDLSFDDLEGSEFELAYFLQDELDLVSVEPDIETDFHPWKQSGIGEGSGPAIAKYRTFGGKGSKPQPPTDRGWALRKIHVNDAWDQYGVSGKGVTLAQVDTGLADHIEFDGRAIDHTLGHNLYNPGNGAVDPLKRRLFDQPGHGTATSSVIISKGGVNSSTTTPPGHITGVAQDVNFVPLRALRSVLRLRQSRVARAVELARKENVHIITMSLGGLPSRSLKKAIKRAVKDNIIVMAAAGNYIGPVVWPARYRHCIAVAGTTKNDVKAKISCKGKQVDFSAPGENVWHADRDKPGEAQDRINPGTGTSFSVALSAGVAALWLEHHHRPTLESNVAAGETLQERFRCAAKRTARTPKNWPKNKLGTGIINALEILADDGNPTTGTHSSPQIEKRKTPDNHADFMLELLAAKPYIGSEYFKSKPISSFSRAEMDIIALEVIWRLLNERQAYGLEKEAHIISSPSSRLQSFLVNNPDLAGIIP